MSARHSVILFGMVCLLFGTPAQAQQGVAGRAVVIKGTYQPMDTVYRSGEKITRIQKNPPREFTFYYDGAQQYRCDDLAIIFGQGTKEYHYGVYSKRCYIREGVSTHIALPLLAQLGFRRETWQKIGAREDRAVPLDVFRMAEGEEGASVLVERATKLVAGVEMSGRTSLAFSMAEITDFRGVKLARVVTMTGDKSPQNKAVITIQEVKTPATLAAALFQLPKDASVDLGLRGLGEEEWKKRIVAEPENDVLLYNFAQSLAREREYKRASQLLEKAVKLNQQAPGYLTRLAEMHIFTGDLQAAEMIYKHVLKDFPKYGPVYYGYGNFLRRQLKQPARAAAIYEDGLQAATHPEWRKTRLMLDHARALQKAGDVDGAAEAYRRVVAEYPRYRRRYARFLEDRGDVAGAIAQYEKHYEENPDSTDTLSSLAELYATEGRHDKAIAKLERYHEIATYGHADTRKRILELWRNAGGITKARALYQKMALGAGVSVSREKDVFALLMLADLAFGETRIDESKQHSRQAMKLLVQATDDWSLRVRVGILDTALSRKWTDEALAFYSQAPEPEKLMRLARLLRQEGRGHETLALFERHLFGKGKDSEAAAPARWQPHDYGYIELGFDSVTSEVLTLIAETKSQEQFIARYREAIKAQPAEPSWHGQLAYLLWRAGDYDVADKEFKELLRVTEKPTLSLYKRIGSLHRDAGRLDDAISYLERGRKLPVTEADINRRAGMWAVMRSGVDLRKQIRGELLTALARAYKQKGRLKGAEECYQAVLKEGGRYQTEHAQKALAEIWKEMGKENTFVLELREKVAANPNDATLRTKLAKTLLDAGDSAKAVAAYQEVVKLSPDDPKARAGLARALAKANRTDKAIAEYRKLVNMPTVLKQAPTKGGADRRGYFRELERLCESKHKAEASLEIYRAELAYLRSKAGQAQSNSEYRIRRILRKTTKILRKNGDIDGMVSLWLENYRLDFSRAHESIIGSLPELQNTDAVIRKLIEALASDPEDYQARTLYGELLWEAGKRTEAITEYDRVSQQLPEDSRFRDRLARIYRHRELREKELAEYEKYIKRFKPGGSDYVNALRSIANLNKRLKRFETAAELYEQCLKYDPTNKNTLRSLRECTKALGRPLPEGLTGVGAKDDLLRAAALAEDERYDEAIILYERIRKKRPTDVELLMKLAEVCRKAKQDNKAVAVLEKAYELRAWSRSGNSAYSKLRELYRTQGDDEKLPRLLKENHDYSDLYYYFKDKNRFGEYIEYLRAEVGRSDKPEEVLSYLSRAYIESGRKQDARLLYDKLFAKATSGPGLDNVSSVFWVANGYEKLGEFDKAIVLMEKARSVNHRKQKALKKLGLLYAKNVNLEKCIAALTELLPDGEQIDDRWIIEFTDLLGQFAGDSAAHRETLRQFLDSLDKRDTRQARRLAAALRCSFPPEDVATQKDPAKRIRDGRQVMPPRDARNMSDFIERLAESAGRFSTGSFLFRGSAKRMPAPVMDARRQSAYEILAKAISGTLGAFHLTEKGHWEINEAGSPRYYAAGGGVLFAVARRYKNISPAESLALPGAFFCESAAVLGAHAGAYDYWTGPWMNALKIVFKRQEREGRAPRWVGKAKLAVATEWIELTIPALSANRTEEVNQGGIKIQVGPVEKEMDGVEIWNFWINGNTQAQKPPSMRRIAISNYARLFTADGRWAPVRSYLHLREAFKPSRATARIIGHTDLATTSLQLRIPTKVEVLTVPLELFNVSVAPK